MAGASLHSTLLMFLGTQAVYSGVLEYNVMKIGNTTEMTIAQEHTYVFNIDTTDAEKMYSSFVFQVHTSKSHVTLMNISRVCTEERECITHGSHIGMVQLLSVPVRYTVFNFSVDYFCPPENCSNETQAVLVAVVGIPVYDPIPGGCSLTSALEIDPSLFLTSADSATNTTITFQNSDVGYNPRNSTQLLCTSESAYVTKLKYSVYQKCYRNPSSSDIFKAIKSLITPGAIRSDILDFPFRSFAYGEPKKLEYVMSQRQTVIFNVLASDTRSGRTAAYVPSVSKGCDPSTSSQCFQPISVPVMVCGPVIGIIGLFLCFLAHRFFHAEVVLFSFLISCYLIYFVLATATHWNSTELVVGTIVLGLTLTILAFILWYFTNCCCVFLALFSLSMSFIVTASILFTPIGGITLLRLWYVYMLALFCGMLVFVIPFVAYPTVLNIVSSSLVGSYTVIYSIGLFVGSYLNDIILGVVHNAAIPGYLSAGGHCGLDLLDIVLSCTWVILFIVSVAIQTTFELLRRKSFKKKQARIREETRHIPKKYRAFPSTSIHVQLMRTMTRRAGRNKDEATYSSDADERQALLSPNSMHTSRGRQQERYSTHFQ